VSRNELGPEDLSAFVDSRVARYVELWDSANSKLSTGRYHSEDFVSDWFRWVGMVAQDTAAATTLILGAASGAEEDRGQGTSDPGSSPR
jgi:hypothetical protein